MNDIIIVICIIAVLINIALIVKFWKMCENVNEIMLSMKSGRNDKAHTELITDDKETMKAALIEQFLIKEEEVVRSDKPEYDKDQLFKATIGRYEGIANELGLDIDFMKMSEGLYEKMTIFFNVKN